MKSKIAGVYLSCIKVSLSSVCVYRVNFILSMLITLLSNILFPLITILIYNSGLSFPGWGFYEVLLVQAVFTLSNGFTQMALGGLLWDTMHRVREGSFEMVLLKPVNPLFFLIASTFSPEGISLAAGGFIMTAVSWRHISPVTAAQAGVAAVLFAAGLMVMTGISVIMAAMSFKWVANSRLPEIFESVKTFGKYPVSIFPRFIQGFVTFFIPVVMIGCYPARALLDPADAALLLLSLPCAVFMIFGIWLYNHMVKLYESVGG